MGKSAILVLFFSPENKEIKADSLKIKPFTTIKFSKFKIPPFISVWGVRQRTRRMCLPWYRRLESDYKFWLTLVTDCHSLESTLTPVVKTTQTPHPTI